VLGDAAAASCASVRKQTQIAMISVTRPALRRSGCTNIFDETNTSFIRIRLAARQANQDVRLTKTGLLMTEPQRWVRCLDIASGDITKIH
jgi:hypothetical protein